MKTLREADGLDNPNMTPVRCGICGREGAASARMAGRARRVCGDCLDRECFGSAATAELFAAYAAGFGEEGDGPTE